MQMMGEVYLLLTQSSKWVFIIDKQQSATQAYSCCFKIHQAHL